MDVKFFKTPSDLREWLRENHDKAGELWIGFYKKSSGRGGITYPEAVDAALCFGWIDGIRKSVDDTSYTTRFTPRKPGSNWSMVNIKRVGELSDLGLMEPPGLKAFAARDEAKSRQYSYEERSRKLDDAYEEQFRANESAWTFFQAQPPGYRKTASWWVMSAKREETRRRRLATLISESEQGRRLAAVTGN
jgi:uncharacterized protein YdeI (YjbR/CyaY-like superfamily)